MPSLRLLDAKWAEKRAKFSGNFAICQWKLIFYLHIATFGVHSISIEHSLYVLRYLEWVLSHFNGCKYKLYILNFHNILRKKWKNLFILVFLEPKRIEKRGIPSFF